ncbi:hypothetical protein BC941DRAFT_411511 [Chlamydoabsidia padenii]|nr:hypothetical protein BC941DRAFT_411511 [Chlamydoabsidia padenii]
MMTDSLNTSLPISIPQSEPISHTTNSDINQNNKRAASFELDDEKDAKKERRTSVETPVDLSPSTTSIDHLDTARVKPTANTNESDSDDFQGATSTLNTKDGASTNGTATGLENQSTDNNTNSTAPSTTTTSTTQPNLADISLLRGHNGAATAAVLSSLLTDQQQQQFLQTYAQASGQDLTHLTASSLAQAMVSPISVPNFNLLQQLQVGSVITALPGPPSELGLNGHHQQHHKHPMHQQAPITTDNNNNNNNQQQPDTNSSPLSDGSKSSSPSIHSTDNNTNHHVTSSSSPDSNVNSNAAIAAAAAAAAAARNMSNDERRQRRLLRNRVAAKECRKKKKQYIQDLEDKITRLEEDNANLKKQLDNANNKLALSTMQGSESYRLMKEVEELNAKLGMDQAHPPPPQRHLPTLKAAPEAPALKDTIMSMVAQQRQDKQQQGNNADSTTADSTTIIPSPSIPEAPSTTALTTHTTTQAPSTSTALSPAPHQTSQAIISQGEDLSSPLPTTSKSDQAKTDQNKTATE